MRGHPRTLASASGGRSFLGQLQVRSSRCSDGVQDRPASSGSTLPSFPVAAQVLDKQQQNLPFVPTYQIAQHERQPPASFGRYRPCGKTTLTGAGTAQSHSKAECTGVSVPVLPIYEVGQIRTVSGIGVGWRVGGSGSARSTQFLPFGVAQLTRGYGNTTGNWRCAGGSPRTLGNVSSQLSADRD